MHVHPLQDRPINVSFTFQTQLAEIARCSMFYAQSTAKGRIRATQNVFLPKAQILIHYSIHIPPLRIGEMFGENSLKSGRVHTKERLVLSICGFGGR